MSMSEPRRHEHNESPRTYREDWEEWEDDEVITPIDDGEQVLIQTSPPTAAAPAQYLCPPKTTGSRASRYSIVKIKRLKSRQRQKAQNAKAGIRLITDMSTFRRQTHVAHHKRRSGLKQAKFVDADALRALEGEPSSGSIGNWNWLKKSKSQIPASASPSETKRSPNQGLSPDDRPIMIGITMSSDETSSYQPSPLSTTVTTHEQPQQKSFWSPDTPDTTESLRGFRPRSSIYSQVTVPGAPAEIDRPPVPALPAGYMKAQKSKHISVQLRDHIVDDDDDDADTPCTLFEEDGTSPKAFRRKSKLSPESAGSPSRGWWDHVVSPFADKRMTFASRKTKLESPKEGAAKCFPVANPKDEPSFANHYTSSPMMLSMATPPIVRVPTPRRTPSPAPSSRALDVQTPELHVTTSESRRTEKPRIIVTNSMTSDGPPPYSPPKRDPVRYMAVFPPGHPLQSQFPPSPSPGSPGLAATMTSQGATQMNNLTSVPPSRSGTPASQMQLPTRPAGTCLPQEHAYVASGPANRVERSRRRHEKEEMVARRVGGFWRGRACIPATGCFGRPGREGRKKRRICIAIWSSIVLCTILTTVLAVVLTRPHEQHEQPSIWVNLTDFPPMPTGVLTVVGPDNTIARNGCTEPSTLWSCSLPKEDHESVTPYKPNQPTVIMQVQWDNSSRNAWKVDNGDPPPAVTRRSLGFSSFAGSFMRARDVTNGFNPNPPAPDFKEMWFLGDTTDDIQSGQKAGEPTPFYISLLKSVNDTIALPNLQKRRGLELGNKSLSDLLPAPDLEADGTPSPAVLLPTPEQQPVRLFDRGLDTEHYGFYTSFKRTIFLKSVTVLNDTKDGDVPLDENGGCRKSEADFLTTWGETRVLVRIWTRKLASNTSSLLRPDAASGDVKLQRPGTMPYPVTVRLDTHGGDPTKKLVWDLPMDNRQRVDLENAELLANDMSQGGTYINPRASGDAKYGGFDGGTGGYTTIVESLVYALQYLIKQSCRKHLQQTAFSCNTTPPQEALMPRAPRQWLHSLLCRPICRNLSPNRPSMTRSLVTLAIETSCDDTAVAILEQTDSSSSSSSSSSASNRTTTTLHFNERISSDSREFKGIKPSVATRGHNESLAKLIKRAIPYLPKHASKPDFVCTTRGPGINPNLNIGLSTGKGLAVAWDVPFVGVHHMQAHALTPRLVRALGMPMATSTSTTTSTSTPKPTTSSGPDFPFLSLLVSGGHTQLVHSASLTEHHIIATTGDTAIGNILDQTARVILPPSALDASPDVMYGRILENYAFPDPTPDVYSSFFTPASSRAEELVDVPSGYSWTLALPFRQSRRLAYSFSSFYTNVHKIAAAAAAAEEEEGKPPMDDAERRTLARHTMRAAFQHLASRLCLALEDVPHLREASTLVVAGGVASNRFLMHVLRTTLDARGFGHMEILAPPIALCTDNAAMIAWAGMEMYRAGWHTDLSVMPITRWPLDPDAGEKTGLLGVDGWLKRELTE